MRIGDAMPELDGATTWFQRLAGRYTRTHQGEADARSLLGGVVRDLQGQDAAASGSDERSTGPRDCRRSRSTCRDTKRIPISIQ
jgi:hypothetical protein